MVWSHDGVGGHIVCLGHPFPCDGFLDILCNDGVRRRERDASFLGAVHNLALPEGVCI